METKTIEDKYPFKWVEKRIKVKKPIRNKEGDLLYKDALVYLAKVLRQDQPDYPLIFGLASFSIANRLSDKQVKKASAIIRFYESEGVL